MRISARRLKRVVPKSGSSMKGVRVCRFVVFIQTMRTHSSRSPKFHSIKVYTLSDKIVQELLLCIAIMPNKLVKQLQKLIDDVPDDKLTGLAITPGLIYKKGNFHSSLISVSSQCLPWLACVLNNLSRTLRS